MPTPEMRKRGWPSEEERQRDEERTRRFFLEKGFAPEKVETILKKREESWHRFRKLHEDRERIRDEQPALFAEIQAVITRNDPMGIIFDDCPEAAETEYESEVGTILPRLSEARSLDDVRRIVGEEFDRWFGVGTSTDPPRITRIRSIAAETWDAWNRSIPQ